MKCGECGYFMQYSKCDGSPDHLGDCGSITMNIECNDGVNPFREIDIPLLQVDKNDTSCALFKNKRPRRIAKYIREHQDYYINKITMQKIGFCERYMLTTAVLNRTKELTRRLEKALERAVTEYERKWGKSFSIVSQYYDTGFDKIGISTPNEPIYLSTRYKLGEVVAVAQSYKDAGFYPKAKCGYYYDENEESVILTYEKSAGWNNKLFVKAEKMPHQIKMTSVRIERLQDITDDDCLKEGIEYSKYERNWFYTNDKNTEFHAPSPRKAFAALINRPGVGRKGLWESNPWVICYSFKLVK